MADSVHRVNAMKALYSMPHDSEIMLKILDNMGEGDALSQRSVARRLGVAVGLVNAYVKRCVAKGLLKVEQVPANRYIYYLTPVGFAEKSRMTIEYLSQAFNFFRAARRQCEDILNYCAAQKWRRIALYGASDLAEVACISAAQCGVTLVGVIDSEASRGTFVGLPVYLRLEDIPAVDAVMITDLKMPQETYNALRALRPDLPLLFPPMLRISKRYPEVSV